jgi:hypothetical protein
MTLENVSAPVKATAKRLVLLQFPHHEQRLLKTLRWRDPIEPYERQVWSRFLNALTAECHSLIDAENWSVPDLMGLLSAAQTRALKQAQDHLAWTDADTGSALRASFQTLAAARHEECIGISNKERESLTHWTQWEELYDQHVASPAVG